MLRHRSCLFILAPDRPSSIRQTNPALSDPKYGGRRISRTDLQVEDSDQDVSDDEDVESDSDSDSASEHNGPQVEHSQRELTPPAHTPVAAHQELSQPEGAITSDLASTLRATREGDRRKGKAVARQIVSGRVLSVTSF